MQRIIGMEHLLAVIVEHLAFAGEPKTFLASLNQQRFEQPLQRADLLAHGRLRHLVNVRGLGETFRLGQIAKDFKSLDLHKLNQYKASTSESTNVLLNLR